MNCVALKINDFNRKIVNNTYWTKNFRRQMLEFNQKPVQPSF